MSIQPPIIPADSHARRSWKIDQACTDFENCFRAGRGPLIEDYLFLLPPDDQPEALLELVLLEWELRLSRGESPDIEFWLHRFPQFREVLLTACEESHRQHLPVAADLPHRNHGSNTPFRLADLRQPGSPTLSQSPSESPVSLANPSSGEIPAPPPLLPARFQYQSGLGRGGHGVVCLAFDTLTHRQVAIKALRTDRPFSPARAAALRDEARLAARLRHPGIVLIHEVLESSSGWLVVEEYLSGGDLKSHLQPGGLPPTQVIDWFIVIAGAVAHAHQHDLFHCDLKPANIVLDEHGRPRICDFGLAVLDDELDPRDSFRAGTTAYMAPEQIRGESHRLDGRTDVWSLGVILYELLTGRCPFRGTESQIEDQILLKPPRPLRELRPELSSELERICLKCLARRPIQRYQSASDLVADLEALRASQPESPQARATARLISDRGLRAFDAHDHLSFLELLPGERDQRGLPEPLVTWRRILESRTPNLDTAAAVWHGPSGSGKSSLLQAGLIPLLAPHVLTISLDSSTPVTPDRILSRLRLCFPAIPTTVDLPTALTLIRKGAIATGGRKIVLILDQFEQWLHGWGGDPTEPLVQAFRQCDGGHIQLLLLIREEFWPPLLRLFASLEIPLLPPRNVLSLQPLEPAHAHQVLLRLGQSQRALPDNLADLTLAQGDFLRQAIDQLTVAGSVLPVRLALFADLVRNRPWVPETLQSVGGDYGLAVAFLRRNLDPDSAPKHHRHLAAAQQLLQELLPPTGVQIRGRRRSLAELRKVTGFDHDPAAFTELLELLDGQLRLITPVPEDPPRPAAGVVSVNGPVDPPAGHSAYQLTHDHLVPAIRTWLRLHQRATPQGRARQLLAEHSALWQSHPRVQSLPGILDDLRIRRAVPRSLWTPAEADLLARSGRHHGTRLTLVVFLLVLTLGPALWHWNRLVRQQQQLADSALVQELVTAEPRHWPVLLDSISRTAEPARWQAPLNTHLRQALASPDSGNSVLPLRLAQLVNQPSGSAVRSVGELLMQSELPHLAVALDPWRTHAAVQDPAFLTELWNRVTPPSPTEKSPSPTPASLLQTATLLAATSPEDPRWVTLAPRVCELLVELPPDEIAGWRTLLYPARQAFLSHLVALCELPTSAPRERAFALESLSSWGRGNPSVLATALLNADPVAFRRLISIARLERSALIPKLLDELARPRPRELVWNDPFPPIDPAQLPADLVREITAAAGAIQPQSAYCLRLPLSRFQAITEQLAQFQFRPLMLASFVAVSPSQVSVIWIRDGQSAITRVGLTPESVLTLDQGFRSRGWQVLGLAVDETRAFWSAVWGPPAPWNTGFTTPVPLIPRVDLHIRPFPAQPWRVRFEGPAEEVSSAPGSDSRPPSRQPLWLGEYNSLGMAVRDFCDRFPKHTAGVRMTAQTSFSSPPGRFCCSTICLDPAASPQIDGQPLGEAHAPTIDQPFRRISWITLAGGSHTLSVTQDWTVVDRRAECQVGLPSVTVIGAPDHQTWYDRPIGLSDPEDLKTLRQPDFDVVKQVHSPVPEFSNSLACLFAEGYRPSYLRYSGSSTALDLCRPRPAFAQIDRDACRRVRAALALQWLAAPESGLVTPLLQILDRRLPSGSNDPDPTLQTELVQHLATYPLPNPAPWLALSPSRSANLAPEAHRSLLLALCLAGRQMAPATRSLWLAQLDLPAQRSAHRDAGVHSALELLLATWEALDQRSSPGSRLVQAVDQVISSTSSPSAGDGLSPPPIPEPSVPPPPPPGERPLWWRAPHGLDFALIPSGQYRVGGLDHRSAAAERGDRSAALESPFAISLHRVPLSLLDQFLVQSKGRQSLRRPSSYPAEITWIEATEFLNWLSRREGLQPVYDIVAEKEVEIAPAALQRTGYRFPTEREWEIVARCHTRSEWLCGDSPTHLGEFGWVAQPVSTSLRPLGLKLPNPAGLFDLHGNGYELLHDGPETGSDATGATPALISPKTPRFVRGKPHYFDWNDQRLHQADVTSANSVHTFRLARTLRGLTHTTSQTANQDIPRQSLAGDPQP